MSTQFSAGTPNICEWNCGKRGPDARLRAAIVLLGGGPSCGPWKRQRVMNRASYLGPSPLRAWKLMVPSQGGIGIDRSAVEVARGAAHSMADCMFPRRVSCEMHQTQTFVHVIASILNALHE